VPHPLDAMGDGVNRRILELVATGEQAVGTITLALSREVPMSQPAVSQRLRAMREAGLVRVRADGTRRLYSLRVDAVAEAGRWLDRLVERSAGFQQPLDALATEVSRGERAARRAAARPADRSPAAARRRTGA
jgi:DNA-binding transcriptional ArsR family regulator